jgi:hypothetical protein
LFVSPVRQLASAIEDVRSVHQINSPITPAPGAPTMLASTLSVEFG